MENSKKRILIFPAGTEIGLEYHRSLCRKKNLEVCGATSVKDHSESKYKELLELPFWNDPSFDNQLKQLIQNEKIDILIGAHDDVLVRFAKLFEDEGLGDSMVLGSPLDTCLISRSKTATYEKLKQHIRVPALYNFEEINTLSYPIFSKPDKGQGSRGTRLIVSPHDALDQISRVPELLLLEYLPGTEYSIDCFSDLDGTLKFCSARQRNRISNGISVETQLFFDPQIDRIAKIISQQIHFQGPWFFQLKLDSAGNYCLLEIAPRIAGSSSIQRFNGVNIPLLGVLQLLGHKIAIKFDPKFPIITRALEAASSNKPQIQNVYIDLDDTLIANQKIDWQLLAAVMNLRSGGARAFILTRHCARYNESAQSYLNQFGLSSQWFDGVIEVQDEHKKSRHIQNEHALLVDDSFSERCDAIEHGIIALDNEEFLQIFG